MRELQQFGVIFLGLLLFATGLGFLLLPEAPISSGPHYGSPYTGLERLGDIVEHLDIAAGTPMGDDGRIPVYEILRRQGFDEEQIVHWCTNDVLGGPTLEQVAKDDYSAFPFVRALGRLNAFHRVRPILWEPEPREADRTRLILFSNDRVERVIDSEFQELMR
ncbi:MAG: hypothetical protein V3T86_09050 [Planctomycetota bacterium]